MDRITAQIERATEILIRLGFQPRDYPPPLWFDSERGMTPCEEAYRAMNEAWRAQVMEWMLWSRDEGHVRAVHDAACTAIYLMWLEYADDSPTIRAMKSIGNEWRAHGKHRIYFNDLADYYGLELGYYNTGNISYAYLDGKQISNRLARDFLAHISQTKLYYDFEDGGIHGSPKFVEENPTDFERLRDGLMERVNAIVAGTGEEARWTRYIRIPVTESEWGAIQEQADRAGLSVSKWAQQCLIAKSGNDSQSGDGQND